MFSYPDRLTTLNKSLIRGVFQAASPGAINFGLGMPDLPVPAPVREAVATDAGVGLAAYGPNAGAVELKDSIEQLYTHRRAIGHGHGAWLKSAGTIVSAGAEEALFVAIATLTSPGDEILVPDPGFPAYAMIAQVLGLNVRTYRALAEDNFRFRAAAVEQALTPSTKVVVINTPNNPTGHVASASELEAVCDLLASRKVPWVSDEIYDHYTYTGAFTSPSRFSSFGIVVSGLSKSANMMGWRLGWLIVPPQDAERFTFVHQTVCTCASTLAQRGAIAALEWIREGGFYPQLSVFRGRRRRLLSGLTALDIKCAPSEGAFYVFADLRDALGGRDDVAFAMQMAQTPGLISVPGSGFGQEGRGFFRFAFTTVQIEDGLERLGQALARSL